VRLLGAHIGGQLDLSGARLTNRGRRALNADGLTVDQRMLCRRIIAKGEVSLLGARIGGQLNLDEAHLTNTRGLALRARRLTVNQSLMCRGITIEGKCGCWTPTSKATSNSTAHF
jgi:hypothetical protein